MSLDKVLRLAQPAAPAPDASELVRLASEDLERIAVLLAKASEDDDEDDDEDDPDDDGDDDSSAKGDTDHDYWSKGGKQKKKLPPGKKGKNDSGSKKVPPWLGKKKETVKAARELVLDAMVALSQLGGGETLSLSVLTQAEREKPSAHTLPGSDDYPIPDLAHLSAAVAQYKQGKLAGHSQGEVAAHIRKRARALGKQVDLTAPTAGQVVLALARGQQEVPMEHGPMTGEHEHPHRVVNVHTHSHTHNGDSRHACGEGSMGW